MPALTRNSDPAGSAFGKPAGGGALIAAATAATLLLPLALLYARALGDGVMTVIAVLFLASHWASRDWRWLRTPWTRLALAFWAWMLLCTVVSGNQAAIVQALLLIRFFVFAAAMENWVLADSRTRRWLWYGVLAAAVWIFIEAWQQYLFGLNMFGYPRWGDGALTGPFRGPVAGNTYLVLFFPAVLPLSFLLSRRPGRLARIGAIAVPVVAAATMILIGQRMPTLLMALGLCASGLLFRQFRLPVILTIAVSAAVLMLLPVVSPPTFAKLVVQFTQQLEHFWATQYGLLFGRAVTMIQAHPWMGLGWDGFRNGCMRPEYLKGVSWLPVSDPASAIGCSIHPHNYWLQIATSSGVVGTLLFGALAAVWLWRIRGRTSDLANPRRAAMLIAVFIEMWPVASATSLFTVPNAGWIFLMVGWGLAEARWSKAPNAPNAAGGYASRHGPPVPGTDG